MNFYQYITRLYEAGEMGLAMKEAKSFLEDRANANIQDREILTNDLAHLQSRLATLQKESSAGVLDRRDLTKERNEISRAFQAWLGELKISTGGKTSYTKFGHDLDDNLRAQIFGVVEDVYPAEEESPSASNYSRMVWLLIPILMLLGVGIYWLLRPEAKTNAEKREGCILKVQPFCNLYAEPDERSMVIMELPAGTGYTPIEVKRDSGFFGISCFFKIKVNQTEGWVNYGRVEQTPECFDFIQKNVQKKPLQTNATPTHNTPEESTVPRQSSNAGRSRPQTPPVKQQQDEPTAPTEDSGCYLTGGMLTTLFSKPTMFSERISELTRGKRYKILDKTVFNHGGLAQFTFYKVNDGNGNIGWVQHDADLKVPAECR